MDMTELFNIDPVKSPRLKWMDRHHITVRITTMPPPNTYQAKHGMAVVGYGATYDDALFAAAKSLNIKLWNEEKP